MATIRIHQDRENQLPQARSKLAASNDGGNQKRSVLGQLNIGNVENTSEACRNKQTFGKSKTIKCKENHVLKRENSHQVLRERVVEPDTLKNIVNPIIPVAQFEAFKVYEDSTYEDKCARIDERLKAKSTCNIYKGTEEKFVTKTEVAEMERLGLIPKPSPLSPMSIEKSFEIDCKENISQLAKNDDENGDFFAVTEYFTEIYQYLRAHEMRNRAKPGYMKKQPDVTASMRTILVDWLVEVAEEYKLHTETLYLAVNYIDRFLSYMSVVRAKLQLVGTAAMFLASKYEEIYPPDIGEFVYITDDTYTKRQVVRMEHLVVKVLGFDLSAATPLTFVTAMCTINKIEEKTKFLALYLCELSMLEGERYLEFLPSQLSASALILAQLTLEQTVWPADFANNTGYKVSDLTQCLHFLYQVFLSAPSRPQHAIQDKYKSQKYLHVSQTVAPPINQFLALKM
ncbi:G2/mitotic-specific cyclin-A [Euwallacea similis]|uniref:G2/mitotic-specific cyclin-A n=1 Tax=Euwallacea similis TaxID=1736056 RepID=UPI00344D4F79